LPDNYNFIVDRANLSLRSGVAFYKDILNMAEERKVGEGISWVSASKEPDTRNFEIGLWMGPKQLGCLKAESGRHPHDLEEHTRGTEGKDVNLELGW
jgi:hypothetical protein